MAFFAILIPVLINLHFWQTTLPLRTHENQFSHGVATEPGQRQSRGLSVPIREKPGMSAFTLEDGVVYHTYSIYARGLDGLWGMYQWLDRAPLGRNETGIWWCRRDEYGSLPQNSGSCCHPA